MNSGGLPILVENSTRLFVEGPADEHAITHLLMRHEIFAHARHGKRLTQEQFAKIQVTVGYPDSKSGDEGGKEHLLMRNPSASQISRSHFPGICAGWR